ncbi:MAG: DUF3014 domain-containing protein [Pseudomonadota bacterium]
MRPGFLLLAIALAALIIGGIQYRSELHQACEAHLAWLCATHRDTGPPELERANPSAPAATVQSQSVTGEAQARDLSTTVTAATDPIETDAEPQLDDDAVRALLAPYQSPATWLAVDFLLDRGATVLVNLADGNVPRKLLGPIRPDQPLTATPMSSRPTETRFRLALAADPRVTTIIEVLERVPAERTAVVLAQLLPGLDAALESLDEPRSALALIEAVVVRMQRVPEIDEDPVVERIGLRYRYVDPQLEQLPDLTKTLLRLDRESREAVTRYAAAVLAALESEAVAQDRESLIGNP